MRKEQQEFKTEIKQLKKENEKLSEKIVVLENRVMLMENEKRKDNIVIKGFKATKEGHLQCGDIENFIENNLQIKVKLLSVREIKRIAGQRIIIAKCETWEQKMQIMRTKNKLKGSQCYIEDDLTTEERKIQAILRNKAREARAKGKNVKMGYKKIVINGEVWDWREEENNVAKRQQKN